MTEEWTLPKRKVCDTGAHGTGKNSQKGTSKRLSDAKQWPELASFHFSHASRGVCQFVPVFGATPREYRRLCNRIRKMSEGSDAVLTFRIHNLREDFDEVRTLQNGVWKLVKIDHKDYPHPRRGKDHDSDGNQTLTAQQHIMQLWCKVTGGTWGDEPDGQ